MKTIIIINKIMEQINAISIQKEWEHKLRKSGRRLTAPRRAILKVISESDHPLTPVEIYDQARSIEPNLGLVTVYRTIEKLENLHLVDRIHHVGQCQTIFRGTSGHQHLLTCTRCGASVYFDGLEAETRFQDIGRSKGFKVSGHWLQVYGLCRQCQKETHA